MNLSRGKFHRHLRDVFAPLVIRYIDLMESSIAQSLHKGFQKENWSPVRLVCSQTFYFLKLSILSFSAQAKIRATGKEVMSVDRILKAPFRFGARSQVPAQALKWTLFKHTSALNLKCHRQVGKGIDYRENGDKFRVGNSTACEKVNTAGTDENLFTLVPGPRHGVQIVL